MSDQVFSRPIHRLGNAANGYMLQRSTRVAAITVNPAGGDTTATFTDGAGGAVLWKMEADSASGASSISFGSYPLLFKNGLYLIFDNGGDTNASVSVAVVEPMSSGT
jgi:hypothetical protein